MTNIITLASSFSDSLMNKDNPDIEEIPEETRYRTSGQFIDVTQLTEEVDAVSTEIEIPKRTLDRLIESPFESSGGLKTKNAVVTTVPVFSGYTGQYNNGGDLVSINGWHPVGMESSRISGRQSSAIMFKDCLVFGDLKTYITIAPKFRKSSKRLILPAFGNVYSFGGNRSGGSYYDRYGDRRPTMMPYIGSSIRMCTGSVRNLSQTSFNNDLAIKHTENDPIRCLVPDCSSFEYLAENMDRKIIADFLPVFTAQAVTGDMKDLTLRLSQDISIHNALTMFVPGVDYERMCRDADSLMWYVYDNALDYIASDKFEFSTEIKNDLVQSLQNFRHNTSGSWYRDATAISSLPGYLKLSDYIFELYSKLLAWATSMNI